MSESDIPKEQLTAYQRWEMQSFDERQARPRQETVALPTASEIEALHQGAYQEGYQAGLQQGITQGNAQIAAHVAAAAQLVEGLEKELSELEETVAGDIVSLAVAIARQVLHQSLRVKPDLLLSIVNEAVAQIPPFNQHAHLHLHPEDASLVKEVLGEQLAHTGWKIIEDMRIERGGCKIETGATQVDATISSRWQKVVAAIALDNSWLDYEDVPRG